MAEQQNRVKCPRCHHVNPPGQPQCTRCGLPLAKANIKSAPSQSQQNQAAPPSPGKNDLRQVFFARGQVIADRYTVMDMIGRGGMGCIYKVFDNTLKEEVALKTLLPQFVRDKLVVERFYNEARIARGLSHPGIVRVHDIGMAGNILYISMEYLQGQSLRALLDRMPPGERMKPESAIRIFDELCAALEYAHQFTVHRDIKPENVMIASDGSVKLMDFGISKLVTNTRMTATSVVMGTPHYMSPEQLRDSGSVDARADVYSMGVMLYEVMTGNIPTGVPKPVSQVMRELPPLMDDIITRCLEPNPEERYASITDLRRELQRVRDMIAAAKRQAEGQHDGGLARKAGVAALVLIVLLFAGGASWLVEQRWSKMANASPIAKDTTPRANNPPAAAQASDAATLFRVYDNVISRSKSKAQGSDRFASFIELADGFNEEARNADKNGYSQEALNMGWHALHCAAAPLLLSANPGMTFIPPGEAVLQDKTGRTESIPVNAFFIDVHEVTIAEYQTFLETMADWPRPANFGMSPNSDAPVTNVRIFDAMAYAANLGLRLPTEAEWMRAASAGAEEGQIYPWGGEWEDGAANTAAEQIGGAAPVGSYEDDVTAYGVADMAGNVSEWTATVFGSIPYGPNENRNDPKRIDFGKSVTVMGGNYKTQPVPIYERWGVAYGAADPAIGFRCVKPLTRDLDALAENLGISGSIATGS